MNNMFETKQEMEKYLKQDMCDDPELIAEQDTAEGIDFIFDKDGNVIDTIEVKANVEEAE